MTRRSLPSGGRRARSARKKQPSFGACVHCRLPVPPTDYFMLEVIVWETVHPKGPDGMMHLGCVETVLGRKLKRSDFSRARTNRMMSLVNPTLRARRRSSPAELRKGAADLVRLLVEHEDLFVLLMQSTGAPQLLSTHQDVLLRLLKRELTEFRRAHPQESVASSIEPLLNDGAFEGTPPHPESAR